MPHHHRIDLAPAWFVTLFFVVIVPLVGLVLVYLAINRH
jgi:hypothetical protein